jgi:hypothetical protein
MTKITIFRNIRETDTPFHRDVSVILDRIRNGSSKEQVNKIRTNNIKSERNELKKDLPAICFSGVFKKRGDQYLEQHSGIICLDFDGYEKQRELLQEKQRLSEDKYVYSVFVSPSGKGLKVLVKVPADAENHKSYFNALENHFANAHFDKTSKNVSRVCYESYDPLIYVNEKSSRWEELAEEDYVELHKFKDAPTVPMTDENRIVERLLKWWERKYPMTEGQRNHNTYVLARAFNDFGVSKSLAEYVIGRYASSDFPTSEIRTTIGSAYQNVDSFGSRYYEDDERVADVRQKMLRGVSRKEIRNELTEDGVEPAAVEGLLNRLEEQNSSQVFWEVTERGKVKIVHILFKQYLEENGFYKYNPEGSKNYVFVRVTNNLIDHTSEKEIKDFVLGYLLELGDIDVYNYFAENTKYFREEFLTLLNSIDVYFIDDTKDAAYLYYRNCAVKVTQSGITTIDYLDLGGYVWKDHVIDRNFKHCDASECEYKVFVHNICGRETSRSESMESTIGYLLHGYKALAYCPAVILNDEVISDNPEGGTGKGIFMNALSKMKKLVVIDGKSFTFERSFAYQLVSADTQILCFDDVKKSFDFERLFSVVTEGLTLEKKNKDAIKIPFDKSPKIAITTNYAIKGSGNSFERRKWELELHQYYSKDFTPQDEFGKLMFSDWDDDEWCLFDNYMLGCLQSYLGTGLVKSQFVNLKVRQLSAETCHEFIEWCGLIDGSEANELLEFGAKIYKHNLYEGFIHENPDFAPKSRFTISRTKFYKWLSAYSVFMYGITPEEGRDATGRWLRFRNKHELEVNTKLNF